VCLRICSNFVKCSSSNAALDSLIIAVRDAYRIFPYVPLRVDYYGFSFLLKPPPPPPGNFPHCLFHSAKRFTTVFILLLCHPFSILVLPPPIIGVRNSPPHCSTALVLPENVIFSTLNPPMRIRHCSGARLLPPNIMETKTSLVLRTGAEPSPTHFSEFQRISPSRVPSFGPRIDLIRASICTWFPNDQDLFVCSTVSSFSLPFVYGFFCFVPHNILL